MTTLEPIGTALRRLGLVMPLASRADAHELLDDAELSRADVERNLADLERLNRLPGGVGASSSAIGRLAGDATELSVLDVGTGRGDLPVAFARRGWQVTGVDLQSRVLDLARQRVAGATGIELTTADARALPFADATFDVSHCSLLLHHLDPEDAVVVLRELARVARRGVVINDLRRSMVTLLATAMSVAVFGRSRVTRHDGLASARRAYTLGETDLLLARAGLRVTWRSPAWMPRVVTVAVPATRS